MQALILILLYFFYYPNIKFGNKNLDNDELY